VTHEPPHADWLWGWDPTPGIVSVWAEGEGRVHVWRRVAGALVHEQQTFRPWLLVDRIDGLDTRVTTRELAGPGDLRYVVRAGDLATLTDAVLRAAARWRGHVVGHVRELEGSVLVLPPEEQYLVASGRTYFRELAFDELRRVQVDLETTGLDPRHDRIFLIALRHPTGEVEILEDGDEAALIRALVTRIQAIDPDVIENHNLHGFDLPFLDRRAKHCGVPLALGRVGAPGLRQRGARRGAGDGNRRVRFVAPGRELIDTLDAVLRHDFAARDLPGHGLKAVARHLGISGPDREHVPGDRIHDVYRSDPERVRRYARADVEEVAALARLMSGATFALARVAPRRYERLADAGPATGILEPLLVRAYLRAGHALPAHAPGDGTEHAGAALHLFAAGVAHRVVKADVASLYPSLMRQHRIGPARDRLGVLLALIDRLVDERLAAKAAAKALPRGSAERFAHEAVSAAMKLVVNSAYGYLGAGGLCRFSDIHAANEVTRRGRETLALMCRELARRGVTLLEADTDGVYFAVPESWSADDERRAVAEVAALLPPLVQLELEGRYAAMLSHEPKNYALQAHDGTLTLRGVAFRSSRAEPFGEAFLRAAIARLFAGDVAGVRGAYLDTVLALRRRAIATRDVSSRVRLSKTPAQYLAIRAAREELAYEAVLASGRTTWSAGEHVRVYRTARGGARTIEDESDEDPRDYDVEHYVRILRDTFATRLARAFRAEDYAAVFADPDQLALFAPSLADVRPILTRVIDDQMSR
jgi:DNA polymerase elongation subunit (family B)